MHNMNDKKPKIENEPKTEFNSNENTYFLLSSPSSSSSSFLNRKNYFKNASKTLDASIAITATSSTHNKTIPLATSSGSKILSAHTMSAAVDDKITVSNNNSLVLTCCYQHHRQLSSNCRNGIKHKPSYCKRNVDDQQQQQQQQTVISTNNNIDKTITPTTSAINRKILLSVPLQRKRKKICYNRDFIDAIGLDIENSDKDITIDHQLYISHYTCVEKFLKMNNNNNHNNERRTSSITPTSSSISTINKTIPSTKQSQTIINNTVTVMNSIIDKDQNEINSCENNEISSDHIMENIDKDVFTKNQNCSAINLNFNEPISESEYDQEQINCDEFMKLNITKRNCSPISDEGCAINLSPYSSSGEDDDCNNQQNSSIKYLHDKVGRSTSSDSALSMDDESPIDIVPPLSNGKRRMTLTVTDIPLRPALLPVAEPTSLPESPTTCVNHASGTEWNSPNPPVVVPSKMILEARIVEIPTTPILNSSIPVSSAATASASAIGASTDPSTSGQMSRRQSCLSDIGYNDEPNHIRYVRTPSVVVSDYSDDVLCGITLEELEFFRNQRKCSLGANIDLNTTPHTIGECSSDADDLSDMSAASSCSNLNYCGSTISAFDDNYTSVSGLVTPERKLSNCSLCSMCSNDEHDQFSVNLIDALNNEKQQQDQQQQFQKKKVCKCDKLNLKAKRVDFLK